MDIPQGRVGLRKKIEYHSNVSEYAIIPRVFPDTTRPLNLLGYYHQEIKHLGLCIRNYLVEKHVDYYSNPVDLTYLRNHFESYCTISTERFGAMNMYEKRNLIWIPAYMVTIPEKNRFGKYTLDRVD